MKNTDWFSFFLPFFFCSINSKWVNFLAKQTVWMLCRNHVFVSPQWIWTAINYCWSRHLLNMNSFFSFFSTFCPFLLLGWLILPNLKCSFSSFGHGCFKVKRLSALSLQLFLSQAVTRFTMKRQTWKVSPICPAYFINVNALNAHKHAHLP